MVSFAAWFIELWVDWLVIGFVAQFVYPAIFRTDCTHGTYTFKLQLTLKLNLTGQCNG